LRNRNFSAYKFRRQHPVDRYILDFYCPDARLAIELDGGGHNYPGKQREDERRAAFLMKNEIAVLRFWNRQVRGELRTVLRTIFFALEERSARNPSPSSSPFRKRERKQSTQASNHETR
jgi:very-short-patch-repair endonuclease